VNVTVTPLSAVPLDVTVATNMLVKASPTLAFCPDPLVAAIAMVGGGGGVLELLLPQPVRNPKTRETKTNEISGVELMKRLRLMDSLLSRVMTVVG
jgi:hypothetical protein